MRRCRAHLPWRHRRTRAPCDVGVGPAPSRAPPRWEPAQPPEANLAVIFKTLKSYQPPTQQFFYPLISKEIVKDMGCLGAALFILAKNWNTLHTSSGQSEQIMDVILWSLKRTERQMTIANRMRREGSQHKRIL